MPTRKQEYKGGVIIEPLAEGDWIFGGIERVLLNMSGDWRLYKPNPERQATKWFDPFSCVSESLTNALEELLNFLMEKDLNVKLILEKLEMLDDDGKANLSGRFLAVMSGTIPGVGNSQKAVFECLRKNGIVGEKVWASAENLTEAQYFSAIPQNVKDKAKEFLKYFDFEYEAIVDGNVSLKEATKKGPLVVVIGGAYLGEVSGVELYRNNGPINYNHQVNYVNQEQNVADFNQVVPVIHDIFDTYDPFDKRYAEFYAFKYAKIIYLKKKLIPMIYKKIGQPAIYIKHWSQNLLIPFASGVLEGGDLFKSLYGITNYSDLPRQDVDVLPFPIASYSVTTAGLTPFGIE